LFRLIVSQNVYFYDQSHATALGYANANGNKNIVSNEMRGETLLRLVTTSQKAERKFVASDPRAQNRKGKIRLRRWATGFGSSESEALTVKVR
jgi:hypothetical protein